MDFDGLNTCRLESFTAHHLIALRRKGLTQSSVRAWAGDN